MGSNLSKIHKPKDNSRQHTVLNAREAWAPLKKQKRPMTAFYKRKKGKAKREWKNCPPECKIDGALKANKLIKVMPVNKLETVTKKEKLVNILKKPWTSYRGRKRVGVTSQDDSLPLPDEKLQSTPKVSLADADNKDNTGQKQPDKQVGKKEKKSPTANTKLPPNVIMVSEAADEFKIETPDRPTINRDAKPITIYGEPATDKKYPFGRPPSSIGRSTVPVKRNPLMGPLRDYRRNTLLRPLDYKDDVAPKQEVSFKDIPTFIDDWNYDPHADINADFSEEDLLLPFGDPVMDPILMCIYGIPMTPLLMMNDLDLFSPPPPTPITRRPPSTFGHRPHTLSSRHAMHKRAAPMAPVRSDVPCSLIDGLPRKPVTSAKKRDQSMEKDSLVKPMRPNTSVGKRDQSVEKDSLVKPRRPKTSVGKRDQSVEKDSLVKPRRPKTSVGKRDQSMEIDSLDSRSTPSPFSGEELRLYVDELEIPSSAHIIKRPPTRRGLTFDIHLDREPSKPSLSPLPVRARRPPTASKMEKRRKKKRKKRLNMEEIDEKLRKAEERRKEHQEQKLACVLARKEREQEIKNMDPFRFW